MTNLKKEKTKVTIDAVITKNLKKNMSQEQHFQKWRGGGGENEGDKKKMKNEKPP